MPFTSGILIGIGETRAERLEALLALRGAHEKHGHLQARLWNGRSTPPLRLLLHSHLYCAGAAAYL